VLGLRLPTFLAMLLALGVLAWGLRRLPAMARVLEDRREAPVTAR